MRARRVHGLDPDAPLADNAQRIVAVRLDELCAFMPKAGDPRHVKALHDMRIAAKRLRYVLEVTAPVFGPYAATATKRAKELQELLGEIHDCDVHRPEVEELIAELRAQDAAAVRDLAPAGADDLDPALVARAPNAEAYTGLIALVTYLSARREVLFAAFRRRWIELEREGFRARLEYAIAERPEPEAPAEPAPVPPLAAVPPPPPVAVAPEVPVVADPPPPAASPAAPATERP